MKNAIPLFGLLLFFTACKIEIDSPLAGDDQKVYVIKQGQHESNRTIKSFKGDVLSFKASFDESAIYETKREENQADINKLMGFSDCNSHHHENSARFGWRWYNDQLEVHAYCYVNGDRKIEYVTTVELNEMNDYQIRIIDNKYVFTVNGASRVEINKNPNCSGDVNYMLFPYFGGDEPAPHDISVAVHSDQ